jgi:hypothetical protein
MDNFVGAILSRCGSQLRVLDYQFNDFAWSVNGPLKDTADAVLSRLSAMPRIRHLVLSTMDLQEQTFTALCRKLGDRLEHLRLYHVKLHGGGWADAVDVLREKLAHAMKSPRRLRRGMPWWPQVYLAVQGGEFEIELEPATDWNTRTLATAEINQLTAETTKYVQGLRDTNPLRA